MSSSSSLPVAALVIVGVVLVFVGIFLAGSMELIGLGVAALIAAGLIGAIADRRSA